MSDYLRSAGLAFAASLLGLSLAQAAGAAPSSEQRKAEDLVKKADRLCNARKYDEAAKAAKQADEYLTKLEAAAPPPNYVANLRKSLARTSQRIERAQAKQSAAGPTVSYTKEVAPLLAAHCGKCHIQRSRGKLSMASYALLSKGSKNGPVIVAGNARESLLVKLVQSGEMPAEGDKLTADELALVTKWIDQGSSFDGDDPTDSTATRGMDDTPSKLEIVRATGKEEVQFARDVAPLLVANCLECHGDRNPRAGFRQYTFAGLLAGGESGLALAPGDAKESLIIKKLRGTAGGARMPKDRPPLADEPIAKIEKWIADGAQFDGVDPNQPLPQLVALVKARASSHEELSRARAELAAKNWHLLLPDTSPDRVETKHFLLFGNVGQNTLSAIGKTAEQLVPKVEKALRLSIDQPLVKGRLTLYVFDKHYDYAEVGVMLEGRQLPDESRGHWRFDFVDAYACIVPPKQNEYSLAALLAQQIGSVAIASLGEAPSWLAEGSGRLAAAKIDPKDPRVHQWNAQLNGPLLVGHKPDDFLDGKLPPQESELVSYAFVKFLTAGNRYPKLCSTLRAGDSFDAAFAKIYGGTPSQVLAQWIAHGSPGN